MTENEFIEKLNTCTLIELQEMRSFIDEELYPNRVLLIEEKIANIRSSLTEISGYAYAGFWRRVLAMICDSIILIPLSIISLASLHFHSNILQIMQLLVSLAISYLLNVYCTHKYGGTPGKLIMKIKVTTLEYEHLSMRNALIRHSVEFTFATIMSIISLYAFWNVQFTNSSLDIVEHGKNIKTLMPPIYDTVSTLSAIWIYSEMITMLFNKKKRAIHDFMAGSIVVRKVISYQN